MSLSREDERKGTHAACFPPLNHLHPKFVKAYTEACPLLARSVAQGTCFHKKWFEIVNAGKNYIVDGFPGPLHVEIATDGGNAHVLDTLEYQSNFRTDAAPGPL